MQHVEGEVSKNIDYETHRYTEVVKELNIERLEIQFNGKLDQVEEIKYQQLRYQELRDKLRGRIVCIREKKQFDKEGVNIKEKV